MKKGRSTFLKILVVLMIIGAIECFLFAALYSGTPEKCQDITDIDISDIDGHAVLYCRELEVLERYAFKTVYEYTDSDGGYSDTTYYLYPDSHDMDKNELYAEYYIVKFRDGTGSEYITSLSVPADKDIASALKRTPVEISACVGASPVSRKQTDDSELYELMDDVLDDYSRDEEIQRAPITMGYQTESIAQYRDDFGSDMRAARVIAAGFGVVLTLLSIRLVGRIRKKKANSSTH